MSVTILEVLQKAKANLDQGNHLNVMAAHLQLSNAMDLLERGYDLHEDFDAIVEKYGRVDAAPDKEDQDG